MKVGELDEELQPLEHRLNLDERVRQPEGERDLPARQVEMESRERFQVSADEETGVLPQSIDWTSQGERDPSEERPEGIAPQSRHVHPDSVDGLLARLSLDGHVPWDSFNSTTGPTGQGQLIQGVSEIMTLPADENRDQNLPRRPRIVFREASRQPAARSYATDQKAA